MIKAYLLFLLLSVLLPVRLKAQDTIPPRDTTYWKRTFMAGINFNQASFNSNWKAGGVNSIALGTLVQIKADYTKGNTTFNNELDLQYGVVNNAGQGTRKTADRIFFDSKLGEKLSRAWNIFMSANFITQFAAGFKYNKDAQGTDQSQLVSHFLAPAFLTTSLGVEYRPVKYFWVRFSPVSPRITFVADTALYRNVPENYGVPVGKQHRFEGVATQLIASYDHNFAQNMNLKSRYLAFANLQQFGWNAIDHRLDVALTAKVNKYVNVNLTGAFLYDKDQDKGLQISQTLAIGFVYTVRRL